MKAALILVTLAGIVPAFADDPAVAETGDFASNNETVIGDVVSGLQALQKPDGSISFGVKSSSIWLDDGREMRHEDGAWKIYPVVPQSPPEKVSATDFALYAEHYVGHRVQVTGGVLSESKVKGAYFNLPGRQMIVWFIGTPREDLRAPIENCSDYVLSSACAFTITGVVSHRRDGDGLGVIASSVAAPLPNDAHAVAPGISVRRK